MKRIILAGLIGMVLTGCGEKKVTEEMLLGDWECIQTEQEAKWKNGIFQDFEEVKSEKTLVTYKNYDGLLMRGSGDDINKGDWYSVSSDVAIQETKDLDIIELDKYYTYIKFEYISDKEYRQTLFVENIYNPRPGEEKIKNNLRQKVEENCIKVAH